jgi:hypothetical protein
MPKRTVLTLFIAALAIASLAEARGSKQPSTAPGKYKQWGPDIDQIEIVKTFKIADYDHVVIQPFDTSKAPLPDPKEKWYGTLKLMLAGYTQAFAEAFQKELKAKADVTQAGTTSKTPGTLIIRGSVEDLDPGSRAGRYLVGYGTGGASTKATIEIVDAQSGDVLARVTQARRSGGTWKVGGGNDLEVMRDSVHALGKDIAHVLDAF